MNKTTTDTNLKKLKKNAYRVSKVRGETASRVRCPGGEIDVDSLQRVVDIARKYGKGMVNITNRQGFEIPGIDLRDVEEVNKALQLIIENRGVNQEEYNGGYPASGTRNVVACPGKQLCPFANYDTKKFAQEIDKAIFPNDHHVKIAFTGCSNDCAHTRLNDFGIIGMSEPQYNKDRCISCEQCVKYCKKRSVGALKVVNGKIERDVNKCVGCALCVNYCPTRAWTRSKEEYFRVVLLGRTGKKNPRMAEDFMRWADHDTVKKVICNVYAYLDEYLDREAVESKLLMIFWCLLAFFATGFEHSIANMTLLTLALINNGGNEAISMGGYWYNLIVVTLGNMIGAILFVALPYHFASKEK